MRAGRALLVLGVTGTLLAGGGMLAYAGWTSATDSARFTVPAARLPTVNQPTVLLPVGPEQVVVPPKIAWRPVTSPHGPDVHRYLVTRHAGPDAALVCTVAATQRTVCLDRAAPPGIPLTYTVAAARGTFWKGPDSKPSRAVTPLGPTPGTSPSVSAAPSAAALSPGAEPPPSPPAGSSAGPSPEPPPVGDPPPAGDTASVPSPAVTDPPPPPTVEPTEPGGETSADPTPSTTVSP